MIKKRIYGLFILCYFLIPLIGSNIHPTFRHLTLKDGLPSNLVNYIIQDSIGYIWIGTNFGLAKYDGTKIKLYQHNPLINKTISSNNITDLLCDSEGQIWVATEYGLNLYLPETDCFKRFMQDSTNENSIGSNIINCLYEDREHNIWIGYKWDGIEIYNQEKKSFYHVTEETLPLKSDFYNYINCFIDNNKGDIFIGTRAGVMIYSLQKETFIYLEDIIDAAFSNDDYIIDMEFDNNENLWIASNHNLYVYSEKRNKLEDFSDITKSSKIIGSYIKTVVNDKDGFMWVGTKGALHRINPVNFAAQIFTKDDNDPYSLSDNSIKIVFEDSLSNLWIGTNNGGLNILNRSATVFNAISKGQFTSLEDNYIKCILKYKPDILFFGTKYAGLYELDLSKKALVNYKIEEKTGKPIEQINCLFKDSKNRLFIGTYFGFFLKNEASRNSKLQRIELLDYKNNKEKYPILSICEDFDGKIWVGTFGGGLYSYDEEKQVLHEFIPPELSGEFKFNRVAYTLYAHKDNSLWIGGRRGLFILDLQTYKVKEYISSKNKPQSLSNNNVYSISPDKNNNMWIGTKHGLNKFNLSTEKITQYTTKDGLPGNTIHSIEYDNKGGLWVATTTGLAKIELKNEIFQVNSFYKEDNLLSDNFNENASYKDESGMLYFGSDKGINYFHPDDILNTTQLLKVRYTGLKVNNIVVNIGNKNNKELPYLEKNLNNVNPIILNHKHKVLTIEYSAIHFQSPHKLQYAYTLEGFDIQGKWNKVGDITFASYSNLAPGTYQFKVKASSDGINWIMAETPLILEMKTAPWKTWWAYLIYITIILTIFYTIFKLMWKVKLERVEKEKIDHLDKMKVKFFTNISHEIKTPLTLIKTPLEKLIARKDKDFPLFNLMYKNTQRLLYLVNQLLDLRKVESGTLKLNVSTGNIEQFLNEIINIFKPLAIEKNIEFQLHSKNNIPVAWFDPDKLEKIIYNILSNAFKFTPKNGKITVTSKFIGSHQRLNKEQQESNNANLVLETENLNEYLDDLKDSKNNNHLVISIADTGIGISNDKMEHLFERFYQGDNAIKNGGSGIGLSHTKELIELHHGTIHVERNNVHGTGTQFIIMLPIDKSSYSNSEVYKENKDLKSYTKISINESTNNQIDKIKPKSSEKILIIDDHKDIRNLINNELSGLYKTIEAENGKEGWSKIIEQIPDLVISDIMMPLMNGYELTSKIKHDSRTSHIPVILLTAKSSMPSRIEGLKIGADEYISKPFNLSELRLRIEHILNTRKRLRDKYMLESENKTSSMPESSVDSQLINKIIQIVKEDLSNPEINSQYLSKKLGLGKSILYIKLKSLTGYSVNEFVNIIRVKESLQDVKHSDFTINQIAYDVGFNDPNYFSKTFKKVFKKTPSEFRIKEQFDKTGK